MVVVPTAAPVEPRMNIETVPWLNLVVSCSHYRALHNHSLVRIDQVPVDIEDNAAHSDIRCKAW